MDKWWSDDFEVLHWVVERFERNGHRVEVGEALGVFAQEHDDSARESLRRLSSHAYLGAVNGSEPGRDGGSGAPVVTEVTGRALRGVGGWPDNAELLADRMLAVLVEGTVHKPDPDETMQTQGRTRGCRRNDPRRASRRCRRRYRQGYRDRLGLARPHDAITQDHP